MRHKVNTTRLNRDEAHLDSMARNLATSIFLYEKVKTTYSKAKFIKPVIEKIITKAKSQTPVLALRTLNAYLSDKNASKKVVRELVDRYKDRTSGYVRVTPLGYRKGDAAPVVQIELL